MMRLRRLFCDYKTEANTNILMMIINFQFKFDFWVRKLYELFQTLFTYTFMRNVNFDALTVNYW